MTTVPVSTSLSRDALLRNLHECGLYSAADVDPLAAAAADGAALIELLVAAGKLTPYQAEAVCERRYQELVIGNYEVLARLGAGGMGTVFKARHRRMKRVVALKVILRQLCEDETAIQRFQREIETIARLSHPNVVLAYDADEAEVGHFLVMEFVDGRDLATTVQKSGPLPLRDAVQYTIQAALGMGYAHGQGIIHRDIKPANLLCDASGVVKVTDLGLARLSEKTASADSGLTQAGGIVGTVDYMSPEQAFDSTAIDHRSDIYSLGCTLHYLLLGAPPYKAATIMGTLLKHREGPIPSLADQRPDVPAALEAVFRKMVAKRPEERFQSMAEVVAALSAIQLPEGVPAPPPPAAVVPNTATLAGQALTTSLQFPAQPATDQTAAFVPGELPAAPPTVLLVEPSRTQAVIIRKYLQNIGTEPTAVVGTWAAALDAARASKPDAVVSALHLKDGTGVQLARQLATAFPGAAPGFILISSEEESQQAGSLSDIGSALVLHKPFTLEKLAEALGAVTKRTLVLRGDSAASGKPAADRSKLRVLLVDDSSAALANERATLQQLGFTQFTEAPDGARAVAAVAQQAFDLIVTDFNMPLMDGAALVGYLRQNPATASVPVVMVTTETDPARLAAVQRHGVAICPKSFAPEAVRPLIERLLG